MTRKRDILVAALLSVILCSVCSADETGSKARAASALISRFETVFYSSPKILVEPGSPAELSAAEAQSLRSPFAYLQEALTGVQGSIFTDLLRGSEGVFVGAKAFQPPQGSLGLGAVRSQRCYVVFLKSASKLDLRDYFPGTAVTTTVGGPIWKWSTHVDEFEQETTGGMPTARPERSSLYAAQVGSQYVVVSNVLEDLQAVTARLSSSVHGPERVSEISDWEVLSRHEVWAYKQYGHNAVIDRMAAGMEDVTPGARAISCFLDLPRKLVTFRLFLDSSEGNQTVMKMNSMKSFPPLKEGHPHVWETVVSIPGDEKAEDAIFVIVGLFGFGSYS